MTAAADPRVLRLAEALAALLAPAAVQADDLLTIDAAARLAATSVRVLREAIRAGALTAYGRQRDRSVRRADLFAWIKSRRVPVHRGPDDRDVEARVRRLRVAGGAR